MIHEPICLWELAFKWGRTNRGFVVHTYPASLKCHSALLHSDKAANGQYLFSRLSGLFAVWLHFVTCGLWVVRIPTWKQTSWASQRKISEINYKKVLYFIPLAMLKHHWNAPTVMTMNKCHSPSDQQGSCEIYHSIASNIYSNDMCSSKRAPGVKVQSDKRLINLSYIHIQLCAIPCA